MARNPEISVVVPVRNGGAALGELVAALEAQTLPRNRFEVIVADDGSTDGATEGLATADGWLRVDTGPPQNSYSARNRGAKLAGSPNLAFCDADCRPDPTWLQAGVTALAEAAVVAGRVRFDRVRRATVWALLDIDAYLDQEHLVRSGLLSTANVLVRRAVFEELGGFDASLPSGGDVDFARRCRAAGHEIAFSAQLVVSHPPRDSAAAYLRKEWRIHHAGAQRAARAGETPAPPRGSWRAHLSIAGRVRARREAGLAFRLNRARLAEAGVRPSLARELAALGVRYGIVYYVQLLARRRGRARAARG
jgi:glycosyltransferase involved in cell wall biosynthesis